MNTKENVTPIWKASSAPPSTSTTFVPKGSQIAVELCNYVTWWNGSRKCKSWQELHHLSHTATFCISFLCRTVYWTESCRQAWEGCGQWFFLIYEWREHYTWLPFLQPMGAVVSHGMSVWRTNILTLGSEQGSITCTPSYFSPGKDLSHYFCRGEIFTEFYSNAMVSDCNFTSTLHVENVLVTEKKTFANWMAHMEVPRRCWTLLSKG